MYKKLFSAIIFTCSSFLTAQIPEVGQYPFKGLTVHIMHGDITHMENVSAIVNAANPQLQNGGGVCGAIFQAAGSEQLADYFQHEFPHGLKIGKAVTSPSFNLNKQKIDYIIHAVAPDKTKGQTNSQDLFAAYKNSLIIASNNSTYEAVPVGDTDYFTRLASIAFPLLGAGYYGWTPFESTLAFLRALLDVATTMPGNLTDIYLVAYNAEDIARIKAAYNYFCKLCVTTYQEQQKKK